MAKIDYYDFRGVELNASPLKNLDGGLVKCQNMDFGIDGSLRKRSGYITALGTVNGQINDLFSWRQQDNSTLYLYNMSSDGKLRYSVQGTGAWTVAVNGTFSVFSGFVGKAILEDEIIIGDNVGSTRHSANGTSFTDTTLAPLTNKLATSNATQRVFAAGTGNTLFYSSTGDASNWNLSGTSDSSSINIPGEGRLVSVNEIGGEIVTTKVGGVIAHWDGFRLYINPSNEGPSGDASMAQENGLWFWINRNGVYGFDGNLPKKISRPIDDFFRNQSGYGINTSQFALAPGVTYKENYLVSVGSVVSSILNETIDRCVLKFEVPYNRWSWYKMAHEPTAFLNYLENSNEQTLLFGAGSSVGQVYKMVGTATSDAGSAISCVAQGIVNMGYPGREKILNGLDIFTSPGCSAKFEYCLANTIDFDALNWQSVGDLHTGVCEYQAPPAQRGRFLHWRLYESSTDAPFTFYGFSAEVNLIGK